MQNKLSKNEVSIRKKKALLVVKELKRLFPEAKIALKHGNPWELLVAVMLSAQCTDKKVNEVTTKLFKKYRKLEDYVKADKLEFEKDIFQTGFYHTKAKNILATAKIIQEKYKTKIPDSMEEMITLPGVARKTANIVLGVVYEVVVGIPVDTHVKRLANLLGLSDQKNPEKIEQELMAIVPEKEWSTISYRLIEYGRKYCPAKKHEHANCPLSKIL